MSVAKPMTREQFKAQLAKACPGLGVRASFAAFSAASGLSQTSIASFYYGYRKIRPSVAKLVRLTADEMSAEDEAA